MTITNPAVENHARDIAESDAWLTHDDTVRNDGRHWWQGRPVVLACESTAEYQRLLSTSIGEHTEARRRGLVMSKIIGCQETLRAAADEYSLVTRDEEDRKTLEAAANSLYGFVTTLKERRDGHLERHKAASDAIGAIRAAELATPSGAPTNVEMSDLIHAAHDAKREAIERDGCCGGTPMADGVCYGIGMCPRVAETNKCTAFVERYLQWVDEAANESALADVSARPSVPSSLVLE